MKNLPIQVPGSCKLKLLWVGPFRVVRAIGTNAYELDLPATLEWLHPAFNVSVLKRYEGQILSPPDPIELDTGPEFEVEAILNHWRVGCYQSKLEFLMSFLGYDSSQNEWLPASHLANDPNILTGYKCCMGWLETLQSGGSMVMVSTGVFVSTHHCGNLGRTCTILWALYL